jgi:hypothetical protein
MTFHHRSLERFFPALVTICALICSCNSKPQYSPQHPNISKCVGRKFITLAPFMVRPTGDEDEYYIAPLDSGGGSVTVKAVAPKGSKLEIVRVFKPAGRNRHSDGFVIHGKLTIGNQEFIGIVNNQFDWSKNGQLVCAPEALKEIPE